ncbi:DUF4240 domain-containing protein [Actinoplanes sp. NPDC051859]|uniref:DUF4240 domain-containing protein n=1 Tax=Actinoplanes sp. NPDC051859 TaxID=3363909 RepID=UPI0037B2AE8E
MTRDEFWALVGTRKSDDDFTALTADLAGRDPANITAFADHLAELLHALDTPAHAKAARAHNDWFLYVRCAALAAGQETYEQVLAHPAELRRFRRREAEHLLTVAPSAYEMRTGQHWAHETELSYESGSNLTAWGKSAAFLDTMFDAGIAQAPSGGVWRKWWTRRAAKTEAR